MKVFALAVAALLAISLTACRDSTRILVVNALPTQAAEIAANTPRENIAISCVPTTEARDFADYDAVIIYARGIYLDSLQNAGLTEAAQKGTIIYCNDGTIANITPAEADTITGYFRYPCSQNYASLLEYIHSLASHSGQPAREALTIPEAMYYNIEPGKYFTSIDPYRAYLDSIGAYNPQWPYVAFISGAAFPVEGNRAHVDTLIARLTAEHYNVYPIAAHGKERAQMIRETEPDAVIYFPMGQLTDAATIEWLRSRGTPLFMPFPLTLSHDDWMNPDIPITAGTLTARVTVPEIDGGITPTSIGTQNSADNGLIINTPEIEQIDRFMSRFRRTLELRTKPNAEKRVAIVYFKKPGKDALVASGMEVVKSLYAFLRRLKAEGYNVDGLPPTEQQFAQMIAERGAVMGSYASAAQQQFMDSASPIWISSADYTEMANKTLRPEKFAETIETYGPPPGKQLARGDSLAIAALQFGNILLTPQPRPALDEDEFKVVHGVKVPPPHSYIAPYLYAQHRFGADVLIHFGTHGNLEFLPGNNAALSTADWPEVLAGAIPHFYFYTIANIGEGTIAKRRTQAATVTYLTPPFIESGMRDKLHPLIEEVHHALLNPAANNASLKRRIARYGFIADLGIDSLSPTLTAEDLERVDTYVEELVAEKVTGPAYVMGQPYSPNDMTTTLIAMGADRLAYSHASDDYRRGTITDSMLHSNLYINHHYLPAAIAEIKQLLASGRTDTAGLRPELRDIIKNREQLTASAGAEIDAMVKALSGVAIPPTPGGDPIAAPNVLPTGRNLYSVNVEMTPDAQAWADGEQLAEKSIADYVKRHGEYPRKVNYTFWAGEFITSHGTTIAQALRMLGVEPVRDSRGRAVDLRLIPSAELGRPRIDVTVQVSGQLRDIAASRLKMIGDAVKLAAEADEDIYPNYVKESSIEIERQLTEQGTTPARARQLSRHRVFGPVNSGYSTGMLGFTERSGEWDDRSEVADRFLYNMCAIYGDETDWGKAEPQLFNRAITGTNLIVQPRQSNTWGPISLDHVYEFSGGLSLAVTTLTGKEPDAILADYRNPRMPRVQSTSDAIAVELRSSLLNPDVVAQRIKGDSGTAEGFGELFRNIFGWTVMRPSALPPRVYDELQAMYIDDVNNLGLREFFERVNPAALQEMTATMLESARKGYWNPTKQQLQTLVELHSDITARHGAPCTEFVCANRKLQSFVASKLSEEKSEEYLNEIHKATGSGNNSTILSRQNNGDRRNLTVTTIVVIAIVVVILLSVILTIRKRKRKP